MVQVCDAALERGIEEVALTDHFEIFTPDFQGDEHETSDQFKLKTLQAYHAELLRCQQQYDGRVCLKAGIEIGQAHCSPAWAEVVLAEIPFDYVIGSMHKIDNQGLYCVLYDQVDLQALQTRNLEEIYRMVDTTDFDCVGHLDLIRRYALPNGYPLTVMNYPEQLEMIFNRLIQRGKGLEINASGLRQDLGEAIPNLEILKFYHSLGGEIITFGSDAHRPQDLGEGLEEARQLALQAGFRYGAQFTKRTCSFYPID